MISSLQLDSHVLIPFIAIKNVELSIILIHEVCFVKILSLLHPVVTFDLPIQLLPDGPKVFPLPCQEADRESTRHILFYRIGQKDAVGGIGYPNGSESRIGCPADIFHYPADRIVSQIDDDALPYHLRRAIELACHTFRDDRHGNTRIEVRLRKRLRSGF